MKKLFKIAALLLFTAFITDIPLQNYAFASKTVKTLKVIKIFNDRDTGTASLTGKGENFFTDLKVNICFENNNPYEIFLEDGYSPYIETFDFGAEDKLLFCSSQTGGSGGYGNYRVYRIQTDSYKLLYDDKLNSNNSEFTAVFKPNGFIEILNKQLAYVVTDKQVILPEETEMLDIVANEDILTLVTCTPIYTNTHRLIVNAKRIDYVANMENNQNKIIFPKNLFVLVAYLMPVIAMGLLIYFIDDRLDAKKRKERGGFSGKETKRY